MKTVIRSNVQKLIAHKMSLDAIPKGGGFADGVKFLMDKERIVASSKAASEWVQTAIHLIRTAAEPNPWKDADDEAIAGELLRQIDEKQASTRDRVK